MFDSLWALGRRFKAEGHTTPLAKIHMAHTYPGLEAAKQAVSQAGEAIAKDGLPLELGPVVVGFAGYGNVSSGAQEIFDLLPHRDLEPAALPDTLRDANPRELTKVVFKEEHMAQPKEAGQAFELQDYYQHPDRYRGVFAKHVPYLTVLINCIYWTEDYPRLVTCDLIRDMFASGEQPRLRVIGDISIDIEGAIECSRKATDPGNPVYTYLPAEDRIVDGVEGNGPVVLAVDNLPCELPVEASQDFGDALLPYVEAIAKADYSVPYQQLELPAPIKGAVVAHRGELTPDFAYLQQHLTAAPAGGDE
jgi:alpha-aminoadipic semialdehyde synthase